MAPWTDFLRISRRLRRPRPTPTSSARLVRPGASAWTGSSSSTAAISSLSSPSWFEHYNRARPHRAIGLRTPIARSDPVLTAGKVTCTERLGGLLREYAREPAPAAA